MKKIIQTKNAPKAIGPYSQGVKAGDFLFISGQLGIDPGTGKLKGNNAAEQAKQALHNIGAILAEAGYLFEHVVKTTVLLHNIEDFSSVNEIYATFFTAEYPARAAYQVANLPMGAFVEIEVIAYNG